MDDWGEGAVQLIEIPTKEEIHDNIVMFWRPKTPLPAKAEQEYSYRLSWGSMAADEHLAQIVKTRHGSGPNDSRRFVLDFRGIVLRHLRPDQVHVKVTADKGDVRNLTSYTNPVTGGVRVSFELVPKKAQAIELRGYLARDDQRISETWLYRWTP
jgi:glucans biosynthesis protein